jgi:hypothetical protein
MHTPISVDPNASVSPCTDPNTSRQTASAATTPSASGSSNNRISRGRRNTAKNSSTSPTSEIVEIRPMSARIACSAARANRATELRSRINPPPCPALAAANASSIAACSGPCVSALNGECRVASITSAYSPSATNCPSSIVNPPARAASSPRSCRGYSSSGSAGATCLMIVPVGRPSSCLSARAASPNPASVSAAGSASNIRRGKYSAWIASPSIAPGPLRSHATSGCSRSAAAISSAA